MTPRRVGEGGGVLRRERRGLRVAGCVAWVVLVAWMLWASQAAAHPSLEEWISTLSARLEAAPLDATLYRERAVAYANEGQSARALADFETAAELGGVLGVALDRGMLLYKVGRYDEARRDLGLHLQRFPRDVAALEYRARAAREAGDGAAALVDFEALFAVETNPNPGHYLSAAQILEEMKGAGSGRALEMLDAGMQKVGPVPQLQRRAIALEVQSQRYQAAIVRLRTLENGLGGGPDWNIELAELLILVDQEAEARRHLAEASEQLEGLRLTPARKRSLAKLEGLQARLGP